MIIDLSTPDQSLMILFILLFYIHDTRIDLGVIDVGVIDLIVIDLAEIDLIIFYLSVIDLSVIDVSVIDLRCIDLGVIVLGVIDLCVIDVGVWLLCFIIDFCVFVPLTRAHVCLAAWPEVTQLSGELFKIIAIWSWLWISSSTFLLAGFLQMARMCYAFSSSVNGLEKFSEEEDDDALLFNGMLISLVSTLDLCLIATCWSALWALLTFASLPHVDQLSEHSWPLPHCHMLISLVNTLDLWLISTCWSA